MPILVDRIVSLFAVSMVLHLLGSWRQQLQERAWRANRRFRCRTICARPVWFESFQNWQSEFLAVLAIVVLSIFLRQDKSPESRPPAAPNQQTGT